MKKYILSILPLFLIGCQTAHDQNKSYYYATPELSGHVFRYDLPVIGAQLLLLSSCSDREAFSDLSGSFTLGLSCNELIDTVPVTDLGYFYQLIIADNLEYYLWQVGGFGYGFKKAELKIDLTNKTIGYLVTEGVDKPYYKVDSLVQLSSSENIPE